MFNEVLRLAESEVEAAVSLAGALPVRMEQPSVPYPIVWTLPQESLDGYWCLWVMGGLLLRQEASCEGELHRYLETINEEEFYRLGSLVGVLLHGAACSGGWRFELKGPDPVQQASRELEQELGKLIQSWDESPLADRSGEDHSWRRAPLLAALGHLVHRSCSDGEVNPTVYSLAHFFNANEEHLRGRAMALAQDQIYWESDSEIEGWPPLTFNQMYGWDGHWSRLGSRVREMALELIDGEFREILPGLERSEFLFRLEVAVITLLGGKGQSGEDWRERSQGVLRYLDSAEIPDPSLALMGEHVWGSQLTPGPAYARYLNSLLWVVDPWMAKLTDRPELIFPIARLGQMLLGVI